MHGKPLHYLLVVVLLAPLVYVAQRAHLGYTGIFVSVLVAIGIVFVGRLLFKGLRRVLGHNRAAAADFLLTASPGMARQADQISAFHRQVLAQRTTSEWTPPEVPLMPHPDKRPTVVPLASTALPPARAPQLASPSLTREKAAATLPAPRSTGTKRGELMLSSSLPLPLDMSLTGAVLIEDEQHPLAPVFLEAWAKRGLGFLLVDVHGEFGSLLAALTPGFGFLAGSPDAQNELTREQQTRYFPLASGAEAFQVGQGVVTEGLEVIFDVSSYEDTAEAGAILLKLLQGIQVCLSAQHKPCALLVSDARLLLPADEENCLIDEPEVAQEVYDLLVMLLERTQQVRHTALAVYLVTHSFVGLEKEALDFCRLWMLSTTRLRERQQFCQYTRLSPHELADGAPDSLVLVDRQDENAEVLILPLRSRLRSPGERNRSRTPSSSATPQREDLLPDLPRKETEQREAPDPTRGFGDAWLTYACSLSGQGKLTPTALRRPSAEYVPLVQALGLPYAKERDLMRHVRAMTLVGHVKAMAPQERARYAQRARGLLAQQQEGHGERTSAPGPPPQQTSPFWQLPGVKLLRAGEALSPISTDELALFASTVQETLSAHGVLAEVRPEEIAVGPRILRISIRPTGTSTRRTKVEHIRRLSDDLKLALRAKTLRMETPVPGESYVGIEIPHPEPLVITLRELLESPVYQRAARASKLVVALGKDVTGQVRIGDLARMPHLLIAGMTGAGKSIMLHAIIASLLTNASPADVRFWMIDPKMVELTAYNGIPHLLSPVVTAPEQAVTLLEQALAEMERRYRLFASVRVRDLESYRTKWAEQRATGDDTLENVPAIVLIIDELADLMMTASEEVETMICRLAQLARATGIHLVIATQRPSVDIITGKIKANIPTRIAFAVPSSVDSRTIIDMNGAEDLLGKGDMLYLAPDAGLPERIQGPYVSEAEDGALVAHWTHQAQGLPPPSVMALPQRAAPVLEVTQPPLPSIETREPAASVTPQPAAPKEADALLPEVQAFVQKQERVSVSLLQRQFSIGYNRASRLMQALQQQGVVSPDEGSKGRAVLVPQEEQAAPERATMEVANP